MTGRLRSLWRTVRETYRLARFEVPAEIMLGLEARRELRDLEALGFDSIVDLGLAWSEANQAYGLEEHRRKIAEGRLEEEQGRTGALLVDVVKARERLFRALGGDEDEIDVPRLSALVDVAEARLEKLRRLEALLGELGAPDLEHLVEEHRAATAELARLRSTARAISPRWEYVARAIPHLEEIVKSEPFYVGRVDRIGARIRDQYDGLGLSISDEHVLYVSLVVLGMVVELAGDGVRSEMVSPVTLRNLAAVTQTYAAALIPYLPEEAKGR